jgi:peptidoglycan hydrolase-like protein with peptidoglycan-binding domain
LRGFATLSLAAGLLAACGAQASGPGGAVPTSTTPVVRTDIVSRQQLTGTLTYAGSYTVVNAASGVFTSLPAPGAVVGRGEVLYRVDGRAISLFYGDAPEWRQLSVGVADGTDIQVFEQNLLALGFGNSANLIADGHFDAFDAAAARRWQASLGLPQTGIVGAGDVIYMPGAIRVAAIQSVAGMPAQPGQPVMEATSTQHTVLLSLDVSRQALIKVGDPVTVSMPDGKTNTSGSVSTISSVAVAAGGGGGGQNGGQQSASVAVTITLSDPAAGGSFDQAPVSVAITDTVHASVLAVPVMALLAQPDGKFSVEVVNGSQRRSVVVTTGLFDDRGLVEVASPELREGMLLEVPRT